MLKGVYRYPGYNDLGHFQDWMQRHNPDVGDSDGKRVRCKVKHGKRRKFVTMVVAWVPSGCGDPACCGGYKMFTLVRREPVTPA